MKNLHFFFAFCVFLFSTLPGGSQTPLIQDYTDPEWDPTSTWAGDGDPQGATGNPYTFTLTDCMLKIDCYGGLLPGGMAVRFIPEAKIDMSADPYILMAMKAPQEVTVRIHMMNSSWQQNSASAPGSTVTPVEFTFGGEGDTLTPYLFDFSDPATMGSLSLDDVYWLIFEFDQAYGDSPDYPWDDPSNWAEVAWQGTIFVDYLQVAGSDVLQQYADYVRVPCEQAIDREPLTASIDEAYDLYDNSVEGSEPGQYAAGSRATLLEAIEIAEAVLAKSDEELTQAELEDAKFALDAAIEEFKNAQVINLDELVSLIYSAESMLDAAVEGNAVGEYQEGSKEVLQAAVDAAQLIVDDPESTIDEITAEIQVLEKAIFEFNNACIHESVFSSIDYFGDMSNYQFLNDTSWKTNEVDEELCLSLQIKGTPIVAQSILDANPGLYWWDAAACAALGQFGYVKDSIYEDFIMELDVQKPYYQENENYDLVIVFGLEDENNYNYLQLCGKAASTQFRTVTDGVRTYVEVGELIPENLLPDHEFHRVEFERRNSTMILSVDGDEKLVYTNDTLDFSEAGHVGIGSWNDVANFDNLQVWSVSSVGIQSSALKQVKIYPVPASDMVYISGMDGVSELRVYSLTGSRVMNLSVTMKDHISINTTSLEQGIYLVQFVSEGYITGSRKISIVR